MQIRTPSADPDEEKEREDGPAPSEEGAKDKGGNLIRQEGKEGPTMGGLQVPIRLMVTAEDPFDTYHLLGGHARICLRIKRLPHTASEFVFRRLELRFRKDSFLATMS